MTAFSCIPLREFKAVRPEGQIYDESHYVEAVKAANDTIGGRYIQARRLNLFTDLDELFWLICCPIRNPGYYPWLVAMSRQARSAKIRANADGPEGQPLFFPVRTRTRGGVGHPWTLVASLEGSSGILEAGGAFILAGSERSGPVSPGSPQHASSLVSVETRQRDRRGGRCSPSIPTLPGRWIQSRKEERWASILIGDPGRSGEGKQPRLSMPW